MSVSHTKSHIIGENIRRIRQSQNISQAQLADVAGFQTAVSISLIEKGERNITVDALEKVADFLHVDVNEILGKEPATNVTISSAFRTIRETDEINPDDKAPLLHFLELAKKRHEESRK